MGMRALLLLDVEECLVVTFADKWGLGQKIVASKAKI